MAHLVSLAVAALKMPSPQLRSDELTVGRVVIPTLARPDWKSPAEFRRARTEMFAAGLYPGVDYLIEARTANDRLTVRPIYPLVKRLERSDWPVTVESTMAPRWMDPMAYNFLTAAFALFLAASGLLVGFVLSLFLTISYVPSASMQPAIEPSDVLLVETLTPRLTITPRVGDLVFFEPPEALQAIVAQRRAAVAAAAAGDTLPARDAGGHSVAAAIATRDGSAIATAPQGRTSRLAPPPLFAKRELFVKRVAALPGDEVSVDPSGAVNVRRRAGEGAPSDLSEPVGAAAASAAADQPPPLLVGMLRPSVLTVPEGACFVAGDNAMVSIDSRVWGVLPADKVVGRPVLRVLPLSRFGWVK